MPIVRMKGTGFLAFVTDEDLRSGRLVGAIENHPKIESPKLEEDKHKKK